MTHEAPPLPTYTRRSLELRAAEYYASIRKPESEWKTIEDLTPQLAEFRHLVQAMAFDAACRLLHLIDQDYLYRWGHYSLLVKLRKDLENNLTETESQLYNLRGIARACHSMGNFKWALALLERGLTIAYELDSKSEISLTLNDLGRAYNAMGRYTQATTAYQQALSIAQEVNDSRQVASILGNMAWICRVQGDVKIADTYLRQALTIARELGNRGDEGLQLGRLGVLKMDLGQIDQGIPYLEVALEIAREIGDRHFQGVWAGYLGRMYFHLGRFNEALQLYEQDCRLASEIADRRGEGASLQLQGDVHFALGRFDNSILLYKRALAIAHESNALSHESKCYGRLGEIYGLLGETEQASSLLNKALDLAYKCGALRSQSRHLLGLSRIWLQKGILTTANEYCLQALSIAVSEHRLSAILIEGIISLRKGDFELAQSTFAEFTQSDQQVSIKTATAYKPHYILATALVGQVACDPRWLDPNHHVALLAPALAEYRRALAITAAPGVVRDAIRDLELIRAAGIEGLEPAFALLEQTIADWQPLPGDALPSPTSLQEDTV